MRVLGIIAEYNPFHNGHKYHLEQAVQQTGADACVAVMSGNFLQRGEPALWDKRLRAKMAVENGIDLIIELPFAFACNNAEQFAYGGVSLLSGLGCITDLAFGCEGELSALQRAAKCLAGEEDGFKEQLRLALEKGLSYPTARGEALRNCGEGEAADLLLKPNNILAAEYLKQCILTESSMRTIGIKRKGSGYNDLELTGELASAGAIRRQWEKTGLLQDVEPFLPAPTADVIKKIDSNVNVMLNDFYLLVAAKLRSASAQQLSGIWAVSEGLENLLKKAVLTSKDMESLIEGIKSKRYTRTRIQRVLIQTLMDFSAVDYEAILDKKLSYAHILAFNDKGARLLKHIKKIECATIPIYSNLSKEVSEEDRENLLLKYDLLATDIYHLVQKQDIYTGSDLVLAPYYKKGWIF